MRFGFFLLIVAIMSLTVSARVAPAKEEQPTEDHELEELEIFGRHVGTDRLIRIRRASCDLFGFSSQWFTPGNSVCAAHCISLGKRGGECKGTVCHCRK